MVLLKIVTYGGGIFLIQDKYKYTDVSERNRRMNRFYYSGDFSTWFDVSFLSVDEAV